MISLELECLFALPAMKAQSVATLRPGHHLTFRNSTRQGARHG